MSSQLINELIVTICHYDYDYDYELKRGSNCLIYYCAILKNLHNIEYNFYFLSCIIYTQFLLNPKQAYQISLSKKYNSILAELFF